MIEIPVRPERHFLPDTLEINSWADLESYFKNLEERELNSLEDFQAWLKNISELEAVLEEDAAWRYIRMSINTKDEDAANRYNLFISEIQPEMAPFGDRFNKKLVESEFSKELKGKAFEIYLRKIKTEISLFREKNIPIHSDLQQLSREYGKLTGALSIELDGETVTLPKAAAELQSTDRAHRESVYRKINEVRSGVQEPLNILFKQLITKRQELAENAGFENYRDYKFVEMGRFDYSTEDCFNFHQSVANSMCPIAEEIAERRKSQLGLKSLKPWDLSVDAEGKSPLKPFVDAKELVSKSIAIFAQVDSYYGDCLSIMDEMKYLDLESKDGKAPGGYNYPLYEIGVPFIFMNAVGTPRDLVTMMHEGGHAVHSFLTRDLELTSFKSCPSEVAELASMSMELLSMDYWDKFYTNPEDLKRAKREHLEDILSMLPWIAMIDKFQHWIYENPKHSTEERESYWNSLNDEFGLKLVDWTGLENSRANLWQKQLHLFEVPFYYIEYGMAQLGALAVWRNYKNDPKLAVQQFTAALKLGYTRSISEIYETAGVKFDFSEAYMSELADFVKGELELL